MLHRLTSLATLAAMLFIAGCHSQSIKLGYEPGPQSLDKAEIEYILNQAERAANAEQSLLRVNEQGQPQPTRMHIILVDRTGKVIGRRSMSDAWGGSVSIATAKAYTAVAFSSDQNALTTRSIGALSQPGGPLWQIGNSNLTGGKPGIIEFPGGVPLYKNGQLVGAIGVSGDGVDQDENVAVAGAKGYEAPQAIRIDTVTKGAVPYTK